MLKAEASFSAAGNQDPQGSAECFYHPAILRQPPSKKTKIFLAFQGGGALGSFPAAAAAAIVDSNEFDIIGSSGASSGLITASFLTDGLIAGGADLAAKRLRAGWDGLSRAQEEQLTRMPRLYQWMEGLGTTYDSMLAMQDCMTFGMSKMLRNIPLSGMGFALNFAQRGAQKLVDKGWGSDAPLVDYHPVSDFFDSMARNNEGVDFDTINRNGARHLLIGNISAVPAGADVFNRRNIRGVLMSNHRLALPNTLPVTQDTVTASCNLRGFTPVIKGSDLMERIGRSADRFHLADKDIWDGGYFENPNLTVAAAICKKQDASLLLLRTRPNKASFQDVACEMVGLKGDAFNNRLNRQLQNLHMRSTHQRIAEIAPLSVTLGRRMDNMAEFDFTRSTMEERWRRGYAAAKEMIEGGTLRPEFIDAKARLIYAHH